MGQGSGGACRIDVDFLHAVIHDLQGPVSRIRILGELLDRRKPGLDQEGEVLLQHIGASAASADRVLAAVRRYVEVMGLPFRPRQFDLSEAINAAISRVESQLTTAGGRVTHQNLPSVSGDGGQLAILFQELISNSVQFRSAEPPLIEIGASAEPDCWRISVIDNAMGVSESDAERIFRPFTKASERSGPGIGLTICNRIALLHGGRLRAVPRPQGAEFCLHLPRETDLSAIRQ